MLVLGHQLARAHNLPGPIADHAFLLEGALSPRPDLADALHGVQRLVDEFAVVPLRHVAARAEEQCAVADHLLPRV